MTDYSQHPVWRVLVYLLTAVLATVTLLGLVAACAVGTYAALLRLGWARPGELLTGSLAVAWVWFVVGTLIPAGLRASRRPSE